MLEAISVIFSNTSFKLFILLTPWTFQSMDNSFYPCLLLIVAFLALNQISLVWLCIIVGWFWLLLFKWEFSSVEMG